MSKFAPADVHQIQAGTGCVEDRVPTHLNGEELPEDFEFYQAPGGDAIFPILHDIIEEADEEGSVDYSIEDSFGEIAPVLDRFIVHNDRHGEDMEGCGFLKRVDEIFAYAANHFDEVAKDLNGIKTNTINDENRDRAREIASAIGRLGSRNGYLTKKGGELVEYAVSNLGADLLTYEGEHVATHLHMNEGGPTQSARRAHDPHEVGEPGFNVDIDHVRQISAEKLAINPDDAELALRILTRATVAVLAPQLDYLHGSEETA